MPKRQSALDSLVASGRIEELKAQQEKEGLSKKHSSNENIEEQHSETEIDSSSFLNDVTNDNVIYSLNTEEVRAWTFADRPDNELTAIQDLADDISENGQSSPIIVRKLAEPEGQIKYEFICGNRRLTACRFLGIKVKALVKDIDDLTDQKAFALMYGENEQREGISSWARSVSFKNILDRKVYNSQRELSRAIGRNEGYIKDLFAYQRIPEDISKAIGPMTNVGIKAAKEISTLAKMKENVQPLIDISELIRNGASPAVIRNKVLNRARSKAKKKTYSGRSGEYFTIYKSENSFEIKFTDVSQKKLNQDQIASLLVDLVDQVGDGPSPKE